MTSSNRRLIVLGLLVFAAACSPTPAVDANVPRSGGFGMDTGVGLQVLRPLCMYSPHGIVASGLLHATDFQTGGQITVSVLAIGSGATNFTRDVTYPGPQQTGADVPFSIALETAAETPWDCNISAGWAG